METENNQKQPVDLANPDMSPQEVFNALMATMIGTVEILKHRIMDIACNSRAQTQGDVLQALDTASKLMEISFKGVSEMKQQVEFVWLAQSMTTELEKEAAQAAAAEMRRRTGTPDPHPPEQDAEDKLKAAFRAAFQRRCEQQGTPDAMDPASFEAFRQAAERSELSKEQMKSAFEASMASMQVRDPDNSKAD